MRRQPYPRRVTRSVLALCLALIAAAACAVRDHYVQNAPIRPPARGVVSSNVRRADYVGSAACARCHAEIASSFARTPMHNMTRLARGADIQAPFDGAVFRFKGDAVTLETKNGERFMRIESRAGGKATHRVTRVIGGRVREDFAGVDVRGGDERVLPVSYLIEQNTLRYKGYSVMIRERSGLREGAVWNQTCIFCHNTSPYLLTMMGPLAGRAPPYQGTVVDRLLPPDRRWDLEISDPHGLLAALKTEVAALGGELDASDAQRGLAQAISVTRASFRGEHLIETGIGCEACHGGSREHAQNPRILPTFLPVSAFVRVKGDRTPAEQINRACARCHQVLFSRYPWTWEGGRRDSARAGGSNINSGEARDMLLGGCAKELSCAACHDPHAPRRAREDNGICTNCHTQYAGKPQLAAHTRHSPDGAAGACIACHMPAKNMSLSSRLTRYHRIGSPTDPMRVMLDRPLECALCHADKTVEQVTVDMERLFGKRYERETLRALYGDLGKNVMTATLERGKPHEQAVALFVLGAQRRVDAAPLVAQALTHPYPLVREYARDALGAMFGRPCGVDLASGEDAILAEAKKCWELSQIRAIAGKKDHEQPGDEPDDGED